MEVKKEMNCPRPKCKGAVMKKNDVGNYVCPNCGGVFVPQPDSIFGVHDK